uniref:Metalloproteinase inhibitor 2 n=1 Tax=Oryctolagus cuniculus TaxID=9986 RepID=A0A5F9DCZ5_RABIT
MTSLVDVVGWCRWGVASRSAVTSGMTSLRLGLLTETEVPTAPQSAQKSPLSPGLRTERMSGNQTPFPGGPRSRQLCRNSWNHAKVWAPVVARIPGRHTSRPRRMFKGPDKDIEFIYTAPSSAVCGVSLDVGGKKEYLIAGKAEGDGRMHITLCDFIVPWDSLSSTQKKSLNHRYQMGCECKISRCPMIPCYISSPDECLWMDWVTEKNINGHQAKFFACIKRSDGSCAWYRGAAPPKQEFLDIEDP